MKPSVSIPNDGSFLEQFLKARPATRSKAQPPAHTAHWRARAAPRRHRKQSSGSRGRTGAERAEGAMSLRPSRAKAQLQAPAQAQAQAQLLMRTELLVARWCW